MDAALGPILIGLSIPMILRWIPPNSLYGFRTPATLRHRSVWYDANALAGRHMLLLGVAHLVVYYLLAATSWADSRNGLLGAATLALLLIATAADWRTANRWARERTRSHA